MYVHTPPFLQTHQGAAARACLDPGAGVQHLCGVHSPWVLPQGRAAWRCPRLGLILASFLDDSRRNRCAPCPPRSNSALGPRVPSEGRCVSAGRWGWTREPQGSAHSCVHTPRDTVDRPCSAGQGSTGLDSPSGGPEAPAQPLFNLFQPRLPPPLNTLPTRAPGALPRPHTCLQQSSGKVMAWHLCLPLPQPSAGCWAASH